MSELLTAVSPLTLKRYELKYVIPMEMVEPISKAIEGHCLMDYYSQISHDKFYTINSLYFDTHDYRFLRGKLEGDDPGYSFRVRSYGDLPKPPYFTEIKIKQNDISTKLRAKLNDTSWDEIIQTGEIPPDVQGLSRRYLERFIRAHAIYGMEPKILTQYRRKAYLSTIDDYARVTFDRDLRFQHEETYNVFPDESRMCHYDHEEIYPYNESCVILELKAEKKFPLWMIDLIQRFDLTRGSFSKYGSATIETTQPLIAQKDVQPAFNRQGVFL